MARKSYATMIKLSFEDAIRFLASILSSGKNPDGSDYTMPISAGLTLDPTNLALNANQQVVSPTHTVVNSADMSAVASVSAAPTGGQKIVLHDLVISVGAALSVTLKCETTGAVVMGPFYMAANTTLHFTRNRLAKLATADKHLQAVASGAGNITVETWCSSEA